LFCQILPLVHGEGMAVHAVTKIRGAKEAMVVLDIKLYVL